MPDYDGRGNFEADADHAALWIPRVLLGPLYVVHQYVLRKPIGALVTIAERDRWINTISQLFTFGPNQEFMLIPTAVYDFGFRSNVGLRFTADDLFVHGHDFAAHGATAGTDWLIASVRDRYRWNAGDTAVATHLDFVRRPDLMFMGTGPEVRGDMRPRYGAQKLAAGARFSHRRGGAQIAGEIGVRHLAFRDAQCCDEPRLADLVASGAVTDAVGYGADYTVADQSLEIALDSRRPRPAPGTGAWIAAFGATSFDAEHDRSWVKYGGSAVAAIDLTGRQRTLHTQVTTAFADPMQGGELPFTELVSMADQPQMQGFPGGWMVGRSTIAVELGYSWPVAFMLDGNARVSVGNAFGAHLEGFAVDRLRLSGDLGITTIGARDSGFELLIGVGSTPFDQGFHIDSVRIAVGSRRGV
jgi:hypothetical protein